MLGGAEHARDRQPGESARAYEAFTEYCLLGAARSLAGVGQKLGKSATLMGRWSAAHRWVDRAASYDTDLVERERAERRRLIEAKAAIWAEREEKLRERRFALAESLLGKAELMLKTPITRQRIKGELVCGGCNWAGDGKNLEFPECPRCGSTNLKGGRATELIPAKWTFDTVRKIALSASDLALAAIRGDEEDDKAEMENGAVYEFEEKDYQPPK